MSSDSITYRPVKARVLGQSEARLVFVHDELVAVVVKLDDTHGDLAGRWYAEASFNSLERMKEHTFAELDDVSGWIRENLFPPERL
jgi:hypothetical protein